MSGGAFSTELPLVSCVCVTEDRAAFLPWLLRAYDSQTYPNRELVVIDGSTVVADFPGRSDIRVISVPHGTWIPVKRNRALAEARGEIIAWFDDDDWQHPDRLTLLWSELLGGATYAGPNVAWFIDIHSFGCQRFVSHSAIFNGLAFRREVALAARFDERLRRASDTRYLADLARARGKPKIASDVLFAWLSHDLNISNPRCARRFWGTLSQIESAAGAVAWADTTRAMESLRARLGLPKHVEPRSLPPPTIWSPPRSVRSFVLTRRTGGGRTMSPRIRASNDYGRHGT